MKNNIISDEEFDQMENERKAFLSGNAKGYTWQEARKMIVNNKTKQLIPKQQEKNEHHT